MRRIRYEEAVTKHTLEYFLPGSRLVYRWSQSNGEHDFDLLHSNGRRSVVEVTSTVDATLQETWRQILDKRKGGPTAATRLCNKSWHINFSSATRIDRIRRCVDKYLAAVESAGIARFNGRTDSDPSVRKIHDDLGVTWGCALPDWIKPSRILMGLPGPTDRLRTDSAIQAAEFEASKPDNRRKLGAHMDGDRHLVVYAPVTGLASFALRTFEPPPTVASLPPEISDIWILGDKLGLDEFVVWRSSTTAPWQKMTMTFRA
jgi:hypothetical protein